MELRDRPERPQPGRRAARRGTWFHRETISLAEIAVQVFSVVLGILLAFGIGNWSTSRENASKIAEAQTAIRAEIQANRVGLQKSEVYQAGLAMAIRTALNSSDPPKRCTDVEGWRGMQTPLLLHSAYDNAIAAGVFTSMALADGQNIAAIYAWQERYLVFSNKALDWMIMKYLDGEPAGCAGVIDDLSRAGQNLLDNYATYLSKSSAADAVKSPAIP